MIQLKTTFTKNGFDFQQVKRDGEYAIYKKTGTGKPCRGICFEVIRIQSHTGRIFPNGQIAPPSEFYPSSESWGIDGFTCQTIERAEAILAELIRRKM